jgi:hypothetical protein
MKLAIKDGSGCSNVPTGNLVVISQDVWLPELVGVAIGVVEPVDDSSMLGTTNELSTTDSVTVSLDDSIADSATVSPRVAAQESRTVPVSLSVRDWPAVSF